MAESVVLAVALETPRHTAVGGLLDYQSEQPLAPGTLVRVPLGKRETPGIVWDRSTPSGPADGQSQPPLQLGVALDQQPKVRPDLRPVSAVLDALPALSDTWRALVNFAASYYQRGVGELALAVLPPELRKLDNTQLARRMLRLQTALGQAAAVTSTNNTLTDTHTGTGTGTGTDTGTDDTDDADGTSTTTGSTGLPALSAEQDQAVAAVMQVIDGSAGGADRPQSRAPKPMLLHGATGSGKTEVYLRAAAAALQAGQQVLVLVPEINLTPQLEARFAARFPGRALVSLHSALTPAQRLRHWLQAHVGQADLVLGTRLAVFASMPRLGLIVVDEEHDPSFKQQDGARYSARDLAIWRAHQLRVPVLLGSATPSLETWQRVQTGHYTRLPMPSRIGHGAMPQVRLVDMGPVSPKTASGAERVLSPPLLAAIEKRLASGEQSLLLLNRRGYAPVLHCSACSWKSGCPHCSAWRVFHKVDRSLRCHHCGLAERVPRGCPDCGNLDIAPIGRGTEKLQEQLATLLPGARIGRIDADSTRGVGNLQQQLQAVHAGEVDVLVGTQMLAKGHDFRRVTLVAAINPDGALFTSDFRAPERLFALLMQAAGRAGRDAAQAAHSEMWVQTWHPQHPLYAALRQHNFEAFAASQLAERQAAGLPPFASLALLRADAKSADVASAFLQAASALAQQHDAVTVYEPVPPHLAKLADVERMQMLVESPSRSALQKMLAAWLPGLHALRAQHKGLIRWAVDIDPLAI
jgi:primosomal protein N' (replication factor Y) (superfamily II helicase)